MSKRTASGSKPAHAASSASKRQAREVLRVDNIIIICNVLELSSNFPRFRPYRPHHCVFPHTIPSILCHPRPFVNTFLHSAEDLDTLTQTLNPSHKAHLGMQKRYVDIDPIITYVEPDTKCHSIEEQ
jgi:hypothetical protein